MTVAVSSHSGVHVVTCPKCQHEFQMQRVGRRARTCPKCHHVGPREEFAERPLAAAAAPISPPPDDGVPRDKHGHKLRCAALAVAELKRRTGKAPRPGRRDRDGDSAAPRPAPKSGWRAAWERIW